MAYNPNMYYPQYGSGYTQQTMPMPPSWSYQPQAVTAQPINGLVSVTGIEGARAYQLPPNSSMPLFDGNQDILYVKTTDAAGYPTVKAFRFEPMEQQIEVKPVQAEYVPRSEFEALVKQVRALIEGNESAVDDGK